MAFLGVLAVGLISAQDATRYDSQSETLELSLLEGLNSATDENRDRVMFYHCESEFHPCLIRGEMMYAAAKTLRPLQYKELDAT